MLNHNFIFILNQKINKKTPAVSINLFITWNARDLSSMKISFIAKQKQTVCIVSKSCLTITKHSLYTQSINFHLIFDCKTKNKYFHIDSTKTFLLQSLYTINLLSLEIWLPAIRHIRRGKGKICYSNNCMNCKQKQIQ